MKLNLKVNELLTEVGTLVGMYGNSFAIDETPPAAEQIYCTDLGNNGHDSDSLRDRWVVLQGSNGVWRQRKVDRYEGNILFFQSAPTSTQVFAHTGAVLHLFDRPAPALVLKSILPALNAFPHLAQLVKVRTLPMKSLHREFRDNVENSYVDSPAWEGPFVDENARVVSAPLDSHIFQVGISDIKNVINVYDEAGDVVPAKEWNWDYYGRGELGDNGRLTLEGYMSTERLVSLSVIENSTPADYSISDWEADVALIEPAAKECLKFYCAARWMSVTLPSRDEEGWNYAKKTETHFRNRAAELEPVIPSVFR